MSVTISNVPDPLPPAVTKLLIDKLYEKRKTAALDVEKIIKDFLSSGNHSEIAKIVKYLSNNYVLSQNQNNKKGGLIGLAACSIALGKEAVKYRNDLVPSVLACFSDPDSRVRYYACESLYNIVKVLRGNVLIYFNEIFDGLCKLCCDMDLNVRNGAELLDRLLKDTVTENSSNEKFDIIVFMQLLRERIYVKNSFVRQFLVSWLKVLDSEPNINIIFHISDLLDGLFQILDESNSEIKKMCESLLSDFLKEISNPQMKSKYELMINIILIHCGNINVFDKDDSIQMTAMMWLNELINLLNDEAIFFIPGILNVTLPCFSYGEDGLKKNIKELSKIINSKLWTLIEKLSQNNSDEKSLLINKIAVDKLIETLTRFTITPSEIVTVTTTIESLRWLLHLIKKQPDLILSQINSFFHILIEFLSDSSKEAVELDLKILTIISSNRFLIDKNQNEILKANFPKYNNYFLLFMTELLDLFRNNQNLRYEKGSSIIKNLCLLLNPEDIFRMLSEILSREQNSEFAISMVDILNSILLTSSECFDMRSSLKDFNTQESLSLFLCLYKTWCHNPIAAIALCLLSQNYEHAYNLVNLLGDVEITLNLLITIDKLVQLIESSIFTYLRLHLLQVENNQYLVRALYGLLMVLPQSDAFFALKKRLDCVPNYFNKITNSNKSDTNLNTEQRKMDLKELLEHFVKVQEKHKFFKKQKKLLS